jgi:cyclic pyranopterin phosphate synthase
MCGYCKLTERQFERELTVDEWKKAISLLESIGIKTIKLMGGEPTVLEGLEEILKYIGEYTKIKYALLSNSMISDARLDSLVSAGLQGYFASVDSIKNIDICGDQERKAIAGFQVLKKLKSRGVKLLGANVVITSKNLHSILETVTILSNEGIWINLCPVIHDNRIKSQRNWEYRKVIDNDVLLKSEDIPELNNLMIELLQHKKQGLRLAVPDNYLINMSKYGVDCSWQCEHFSQLRIDADGALMLCNDIRGNVSEKYNINTLTVETYQEFQLNWLEERRTINCSGCYWSCFYLAEENLKCNRNEFYYMEE